MGIVTGPCDHVICQYSDGSIFLERSTLCKRTREKERHTKMGKKSNEVEQQKKEVAHVAVYAVHVY